MIVVLNEWVFHDLLGENGKEALRQTATFLNAFRASNDKLVLPRESRWTQKAYRLMTQTDARLRNTANQFRALVYDSDRVVDVRMQEGGVPEELADALPAEDAYLVEAYMAAGADVLVTTDEKLHEALVDSKSISCQLREEFLDGYQS